YQRRTDLGAWSELICYQLVSDEAPDCWRLRPLCAYGSRHWQLPFGRPCPNSLFSLDFSLFVPTFVSQPAPSS
ncbi:MAG: hypothetical protein AB4426_24805, partial [Xenococcaceae cyanobacterium]